MSRFLYSTSKLRVATVCLAVAAGLLVATYLAVLEWKQASICGEIRSVALTADGFVLVLPWVVIVGCLCAAMRWPKFAIAFYASFVLSLAAVWMEVDELVIAWIQGRGLWMPEQFFCDRWNWFDFTLVIAFVTAFVTGPFAGVLGLATILGISWGRLMIVIRRTRAQAR